MENAKNRFKKKVVVSLVVLLMIFGVTFLVSISDVFAETTDTQPVQTPVAGNGKAEIWMFGLVAAAVAFGFGAIGAGIAIAHVGAAAMGAIGEKPEIAGQALIFIALAEGLAVFGFITALMILGKLT